jgi:hypothetical protein
VFQEVWLHALLDARVIGGCCFCTSAELERQAACEDVSLALGSALLRETESECLKSALES